MRLLEMLRKQTKWNVYRNEETGLYGFTECEADIYETEEDAVLALSQYLEEYYLEDFNRIFKVMK